MKMRNEIVIFTPKTGKNIFSTECFKEILKVHQAIVDIPPYLKHCVPIGGVTAPNRSDDCLASNPLEMFQFKEENLVNIQKELTKKYFNKLTPFIMRNGRPAYANFPAMFGALVITLQLKKLSQLRQSRLSIPCVIQWTMKGTTHLGNGRESF